MVRKSAVMKKRSEADLWCLFEPLLKRQMPRKPGAGRPRVDVKKVFEAVVWILTTGAPWRSIPAGIYPSYQTCHRYFQAWASVGLLKKLIRKVRRQAESSGAKKVKQMHFVDGSFSPAKKGVLTWAKPRRERELRSWRLLMRKVNPFPF